MDVYPTFIFVVRREYSGPIMFFIERPGRPIRYRFFFICKYSDYFLVLAGKNNNQVIKKATAGFPLTSRIIFPGVISEEEKTALYQGAVALIFPSLYEGFGLPVLEAQSLGVPVITSSASSLPEVAGNGALFVDPHDYKAISTGLEKVIDPLFLKNDLINSGYKNLTRFSWDKSSGLLLEAINEIASLL